MRILILDGRGANDEHDHVQGDDFSKAALYKTIMASYSKSSSNEQSSLRPNKGLGKGLYPKNSAKRRLRKSRRSKREFSSFFRLD